MNAIRGRFLVIVDGHEFDRCLKLTSDIALDPERQFVLVTAVEREITVTLPATRLLAKDGVICIERDRQSLHDVVILPHEEDTISGGKAPARLTAEGLPAFLFEVA
jgi:hypothetical protein